MAKKKKIAAAVTTCALLGALALGGTMAYLTDSEKQTNEFTFGTVQVDLVEAKFADTSSTDIDASTNVAKYKTALVPYATAPKDPKVVNTGTESAVIFLKVEIPNYEITPVGNDGVPAAKANTDIYQMQFSDGTALKLTGESNWDGKTGSEKNWIVLSSSTQNNKTTYVFGYSSAVAGANGSTYSSTDTLFDKIQFVNMTDESYKLVTVDNKGTAKDINVYAYGIQSTGLDNVDNTISGTTYNKSQLNNIWTAYNNNTTTTAPEENTSGKYKLNGTDMVD